MMHAPTQCDLTYDLFLRNMAELWRVCPKLALALDGIDDHDLPAPEQTQSGHVTVRRDLGDGRRIYLHSRYDPTVEAGKWAAEQIEPDKFCYIIEGFGLGYHVQALFEKAVGDTIVAVLEQDLANLRLALAVQDFSTELNSRRLVILTEPNKSAVHQRLTHYSAHMMMGTKIATHQPSSQLHPAFFSEMRQLCLGFIEYTKTALVTLVTNSQITCRNVADNLAAYLAAPAINELRSRFSGYPAIIVSAGPSLRKNVHQLAEAAGKAVIIATQTTFKPLLAGGIIPDFVCSLDYHELSRQFYEEIEDFHDVHLVAEPKAHHSVIDAFRGPVSLLSNEFARTCLGSAHGNRDGLRAGASVAHLAFYLAEYMGCDPIILIGQDLALTHHVYYAPGVAMHTVWQSELNRFCTLEMKEWERIVRSRPILRKIRDQQGREVFTEELMFNYLEQFEKDFAGTHVKVIDATEGGAVKLGAEVMTLHEAIARHSTRAIDPGLFAYRRRKPWFDVSVLAAGRAEIEARLTELGTIRDLCDETRGVLEELKNLIDRPAEFNRRIRKVDELRLQVRQHDRAYTILTAGSQLAEFRKFSADQRLKQSGAVGAERARLQLERDVQFVTALRADAERMIEIMEHARAQFDLRMREYAGDQGA